MARKLRIAASVFFAVVAVSLIILWVRSYSQWDVLKRRAANITELGSNSGSVYFVRTKLPAFVRDWGSTPHEWRFQSKAANIQSARFSWTNTQEKFGLRTPYWFLVLVAGLAFGFAASYFKPRFSMRTVLIVTTLVAVALGLGVCRGQ